MLDHGGGINAAARHHGIPVDQWLDLSTGINPRGWPVPALPEAVWQRLPEADDQLERAARDYYRAPELLAMAGSQAAIQLLPALRAELHGAGRVGFLSPGYAEHPHNWERHGHQLQRLDAAQIDARHQQLDVIVLCRPNNPDGGVVPVEVIERWHRGLAARDGWLVVDEAFADSVPAISLAAMSRHPGFIVLRSPGKFFGLAGMRLGFLLAHPTLLDPIRERAGPWTVSHPARWIGSRVLADRDWQQATRQTLAASRERLDQLLLSNGLEVTGGTDLFRWLPHPEAPSLHRQFARQGILLRLFEQPRALRLGLPGTEADWLRLAGALTTIQGELR